MRESKLESDLRIYGISKGFEVYKFTSPGRRGVADRLYLGDFNVHFFLETKKAKTGTLSRSQKREGKKMRDLGHDVRVVDNLEHGKLIIDSYALFIRNKRRKNSSAIEDNLKERDLTCKT